MTKQLTFTTSVLHGNGAEACDSKQCKDGYRSQLKRRDRGGEPADRHPRNGQEAVESIVKDPGKWAGYLKYTLPGGSIFTFLAGIVAWWKERSAAKPAP